jgi:hypothetical protein
MPKKKSKRPNRQNRTKFRINSSGQTLRVCEVRKNENPIEAAFWRVWSEFAFNHGVTFLHVESVSDVDKLNAMFHLNFSFMAHRMSALNEALLANFFAAEGDGKMVTIAVQGELFDVYGGIIFVKKNGVGDSFVGCTIHRHGSDVHMTDADIAAYVHGGERVFA